MGKIIQVVARKIIQIAVATDGESPGQLYPRLFALADDGTVWWQDPPYRAEWLSAALLPDAEACAAVSPGIDGLANAVGDCRLAKDHRGKQHWNGTRSWK